MDYSSLIGLGEQLLQSGVTYATATASQKAALDALAKAQQMLSQGQANYANIATPNYKTITPDKLGPSQLGGIQNDPQGRAAEQQAIAQLSDIAARGGLNISDQAALNQIQENTNRNAVAREKNITDSAAARGQLGAGATLAAQLQGLQNSDQSANAAGEAAAGQAQNRAMSALTQKAGLGRQMSQDEYNKAADAAKANDLIASHNAQNSMQAQQENNQWLNTGFGNNLAKAQGEAGLIGQGIGLAKDVGAVNQAGIGAKGQITGQTLNGITKNINGQPPPPDGSYTPPPMVSAPPPGDPNGWSQFTTHNNTGASLDDYDPNKLHEGD